MIKRRYSNGQSSFQYEEDRDGLRDQKEFKEQESDKKNKDDSNEYDDIDEKKAGFDKKGDLESNPNRLVRQIVYEFSMYRELAALVRSR